MTQCSFHTTLPHTSYITHYYLLFYSGLVDCIRNCTMSYLQDEEQTSAGTQAPGAISTFCGKFLGQI